jgi:hypothetical protein
MLFLAEGEARTLVKIWLCRTAGSDNNSLYNVYGVYCEQVTKLQGGRELRLWVIRPSGGLVVLTLWRLVEKWSTYSLLETIVADTECVENLGLITVQSSHVPETCECASAWHSVIRCTSTRAQFVLHSQHHVSLNVHLIHSVNENHTAMHIRG